MEWPSTRKGGSFSHASFGERLSQKGEQGKELKTGSQARPGSALRGRQELLLPFGKSKDQNSCGDKGILMGAEERDVWGKQPTMTHCEVGGGHLGVLQEISHLWQILRAVQSASA